MAALDDLVGALVFFLIVALLSKFIDFTETASFRKAFIVYNVGLIWTVALFLVHGWMEVQGMAVGAMIAGIAGLGHILWGVGLVWILNLIRSRA